jgi:hypothetical protein
MGVLFEPAIAHLGEAKHALDDPDRMLDLGPHLRFVAVFRALNRIDDTAMTVAAIGEVPGLGRVLPDHRPLATVSLITPHAGLVAVQQIGQHRAVGDIGRRRHHRVDQLAAAVDPEMRLHAEIPLVSFLGLMHLGIARLVGVFDRGGRIDDGGIDNRAGGGRPTSSNSGRPNSCSSSRWRKRHTVVSSGTGSRPRSMPTKHRIACESYSASSTAGSDRLNQCCKK